MALKLNQTTEQAIQRLMASTGIADADELVASALAAFEGQRDAFWSRIAQLDAEAGADVAARRYRPVTDEFVQHLKSLVTRPTN